MGNHTTNRESGKNLFFPLGPDCWGLECGNRRIGDVQSNTKTILILISASAKESCTPTLM